MHLKSTNLTHLEAIVNRMETLPDVTHVLKRFQPMEGEPVIIDVICNQGYTWVKVIARKAEALHRIWAGGGQFGDKNLVEQAIVYAECTKLYTRNFTQPQLLFLFCQGVSSAMKTELEKVNVKVDGQVYDLDFDPYANTRDVTDSVQTHTSHTARKDMQSEDVGFWSAGIDFGDNSDSDSNEELLTASELLQRQKKFSNMAQKQNKHTEDSLNGRSKRSNIDSPSNFIELISCHGDDLPPAVRNDGGVLSTSQYSCSGDNNLCDMLYAPTQPVDAEISQSLNKFSEGSQSVDKDVAQSVKKSSDIAQIVPAEQLNSSDNRAAVQYSQDTERARNENDGNFQRILNAPQQHDLSAHTSTEDAKNFKHSSLRRADGAEKFCDNTANSQSITMHLVSQPQIIKLNLDITTLISYISNLCHGHCHYKFKEPILTQQAAQERRRPLLPILDQYFQGKELFMCETALNDFRSILSTVGGPSECKRAEKFLARITVIPDDISPRIAALQTSAKIKQRAKVIFGTAESFQAVTVTANSGFVRAAEHKGICIPVILHESRALTEKKQRYASPI